MQGRRKPRVVWVNTPPPIGDVMHITRIPASGVCVGTVISPGMVGTFTHWMDRRTRKCVGMENNCAGCAAKIRQRWVGFVQWVDLSRGFHGLLELTHLGGKQMQAILEQYNTLRGLRLAVGRERNDKRAPLKIDVLEQMSDVSALPNEKNILPTLERLWGYLA